LIFLESSEDESLIIVVDYDIEGFSILLETGHGTLNDTQGVLIALGLYAELSELSVHWTYLLRVIPQNKDCLLNGLDTVDCRIDRNEIFSIPGYKLVEFLGYSLYTFWIEV
jgi:hypothetical protein